MASKIYLVLLALVLLHASPAFAFGAGNIASISKIEGHNWRHGDIEDMLKIIAFIKGHKWTSMMVKRVYFGNWLRDYSQAMDVGTLKGIQADSIRVLVWVLGFLSFGYATAEFEVTAERLGVYRPEEHIDNPKGYADDKDAREFDKRLRPPIEPIELEVDPATGMKNYIANDNLGIATSVGYITFSFTRSIHFGRLYTSGAHGTRGNEDDLYEALRCLGQGLHCLEDFGAHTNYTELALRELGHREVFPHVGSATEVTVRGHRIFPLVTGTFGTVDFLHSVLGEATDHFAQSEVEQLDLALKDCEAQSKAGDGSRSTGSSGLADMTGLLSNVPGAGDLAREAQDLQARSDEQIQSNEVSVKADAPVNVAANPTPGAMQNIPGTNIDPVKVAKQIYPILEFRDKVVKMIALTIEKIPGLEALVQRITDTLTAFILSLLAPFVRPIINAVSKQLSSGSGGVIDASGRSQYEPWTDAHCSDPTHSLLSKDHFSNILNEPAGQVASTILQYVAPRIIYAWEHPDVPVSQVTNDITRVFHHPALRDPSCEVHRSMYETVSRWARTRPDGGSNLNTLLSSASVRHGKNHTVAEGSQAPHTHGGGLPGLPPSVSNQFNNFFGAGSHSKMANSPWERLSALREIDDSDLPAAPVVAAAFPGTQTEFDSSRPPTGPDVGYAAQPSPFQTQDPYAAPPYPPGPDPAAFQSPPQGEGFYPQQQQPPPQQWEQGQGYPGQAPPGPPFGYPTGPPPPMAQFGYGYEGGAPPPMQYGYGYDPNAPPPPGYGGYQGGPPAPSYG